MNPLSPVANSSVQTLKDLRRRAKALASQIKDHVAVAKRHHAQAMTKQEDLRKITEAIKALEK